jgi:hypothetical protein
VVVLVRRKEGKKGRREGGRKEGKKEGRKEKTEFEQWKEKLKMYQYS